MEKSWQVWRGNLDEKILQFLFVEFILIFICNLQYCVKFPPPTSIGGKAKAIPSCPWSPGLWSTVGDIYGMSKIDPKDTVDKLK